MTWHKATVNLYLYIIQTQDKEIHSTCIRKWSLPSYIQIVIVLKNHRVKKEPSHQLANGAKVYTIIPMRILTQPRPSSKEGTECLVYMCIEHLWGFMMYSYCTNQIHTTILYFIMWSLQCTCVKHMYLYHHHSCSTLILNSCVFITTYLFH